jgi:hypothetical protein
MQSTEPNDAQLMASVLYPKFTPIASVVGSSLIIRDIILLRQNRSDGLSARYRILAGMSICDILSSSAWFLTSWPVPKDTPFGLWNVGNKQTCSTQGFFIQLAIGTVTYNACLALYYLLVIRYGWRNEYIAKHVEPWMHFVAVGFALSSGVAGLALDLFNPFGYICTLSACNQSFENKGHANCTRRDNARVYLVALWLGPVCCIIVFIAVSLLLVYSKIRTIERSSSRFQQGQLQYRFALQSAMYVGAMLITWGPSIGLYIYQEITSKAPIWWVSRPYQRAGVRVSSKGNGP